MNATVEATIEVDIARPREVVWGFVTNPRRSPDWIEEFVESHLVSEELGVGAIVAYTIDPGRRSGTFELTEWDPPHRMAWDGPALRMMRGSAAPRGSFELSERGDRTTHLVAQFRPAVSGPAVLLKPLIARWLRRQRATDLRRLKTILEHGGR